MAKGKRASLKDKDSESLGLTPKKGKGIDLLFGGPSSTSEASADEQSDSEADIVESSAAVDTSLSGITASDDRLVDELGLPVALEEPPDDLILASPPTDAAVTGGEDAVDPSMSPFAMPTVETLESSEPTGNENDLSGILVEDVSPIVEEENLSSSLQENDLSGLVDDNTSPDTVSGSDLSGMVNDDLSDMIVEDSPGDLSGLTSTSPDIATTPTGDLSGLGSDVAQPVTTPPPVTFPPSSPPPTTAAPINVPPPTTPQPRTTPNLPEAARVAVNTFSGVVAEGGTVSAQGILPEDALLERGDNILAVEKRTLEQDEAVTEKVLRYIGRERRERLDQQIEAMYERVANELSDHKDDAAFALKTLSAAQDIVIEDPRQYDEALYRVAVVKTMLVRKRNLRRWSYSWGLFVYFFAIAWMGVFIAGFFIDFGNIASANLSETADAVRSAWASGLSGGLGGVLGILYSLSWRVAIKHEFDRQYIMKYLVQPFMGFLLGAIVFFITSAGFLVLGGNPTQGTQFLGGNQLIFVQILLGVIAGFRQRDVYYWIDRIVQRLSPTATESKEPSSVVPSEDYARLQEAEDVVAQKVKEIL